jgi:hypothetical protein
MLAVLIAILLTYSVGHIATQWFDIKMSLAQHDIEALTAILGVTAVVALLVVIGFVVAFSLLAALMLSLVAVALFVAGLSVSWPILLFASIVFFLVKDNKSEAY